MATTETDLERFLVEWYGRHASASAINKTAGPSGKRIQLLMVLAVPEEDYVFGVFAAESAQTVAQVCVDAGAPATPISAAVRWRGAFDCRSSKPSGGPGGGGAEIAAMEHPPVTHIVWINELVRGQGQASAQPIGSGIFLHFWGAGNLACRRAPSVPVAQQA